MTCNYRSSALALVVVLTLAGCGGGSSGNGATPAPTATLSSSATNVAINGSMTLTWSSSNATSCTASDSWSGGLAPSGSQNVVVAQKSTFSLSCSGAGGNATASIVVAVAPMVLAVTVRYQSPGPPVVGKSGYYVPDWAHPIVAPVPYVFVEVDDPAGNAAQVTYANAKGVATFTGLDPRVKYTPQIRSHIKNPALDMDFEVLNNTAPTDTSQGAFRSRYPSYSTSFPAYTPTSLVQQSLTVTAPDGWDASIGKLVDANRIAAPYELLAFASFEAVTVSAAAQGAVWRPLTILWSVTNKGGLAAPPDNYDQGTVTGSGGFYSSGHWSIDSGGTASGSGIAEDFIFLSGDQTTEAMDIYPTIMAHEMGHFAQVLFSTLVSPSGDHSYDDYQDFTLAWVEGSASGIAALVMNTPTQDRLAYVSGEIIVDIVDISNNTVSGNPQSWPIGWYQETTNTAMMWAAHDPQGSMHLSVAATLAPMFSTTWNQAPYLNSIWAYDYLLKQANPAAAAAIDSWSAMHNIVSAGNDAWGSAETYTGNRTAQDSLPPYTAINIGQTVQVCSAGAPLEYNKESNVRFLFLQGDGASHTLTAQGPSGSVPILAGFAFTAGSTSTWISDSVPVKGTVTFVGDCSVAYSPYASDTVACSEPVAPPAEQCWNVTWQ